MELTNPQAVLSIHPLGPHLERRPSDTQELPVDAFDRNISDMIISAASSEELPQMTRRKNETTGQTKEKERTHRDSSGLVAARVSRRLDRYSLDGIRQPQISNVRSPCKWKDKKLKECWPNCVSNQFFFFFTRLRGGWGIRIFYISRNCYIGRISVWAEEREIW